MELKACNRLGRLLASLSFNRTFMELKVDVSVEARNENNGFNRTFMELKENHLAKWNNAQIVSIAPLWN